MNLHKIYNSKLFPKVLFCFMLAALPILLPVYAQTDSMVSDSPAATKQAADSVTKSGTAPSSQPELKDESSAFNWYWIVLAFAGVGIIYFVLRLQETSLRLLSARQEGEIKPSDSGILYHNRKDDSLD